MEDEREMQDRAAMGKDMLSQIAQNPSPATTEEPAQGDGHSCVLREALERIANHPHSQYGVKESDYDIGVVDGHRCAAKIAKRALAQAAIERITRNHSADCIAEICEWVKRLEQGKNIPYDVLFDTSKAHLTHLLSCCAVCVRVS